MFRRDIAPKKSRSMPMDRARSREDVPYAEHGEDKSRDRKRKAFWASSVMSSLILRLF